MNCGEKIAELRKKHGMTQAELGDALNVTYQAVSKWERGESQPDFETMSKIAKLFNVPLGHFADGESDTQLYDQSAYTEAPAQKTLIGTCTECGRVVYEGEECETSPKLVCGECRKRQQQETAARQEHEKQRHIAAVKSEIGSKWGATVTVAVCVSLALYILFTVLAFLNVQDSELYAALIAFVPLCGFGVTFTVSEFICSLRDWDEANYCLVTSLVTAAGFALVNAALFLTLYLTLSDNFYYLILLGVSAVISFAFVSQFMWGGVIAEIFSAGGFTFKLPGFIFSLTVDSIIWMIVTKIFLAIVAAIVLVVTTVVVALVAMLGSPVIFIPSLLCTIRRERKSKKELRSIS